MRNDFESSRRSVSRLVSIPVAVLALTFLATDVSAQETELEINNSYTIKVSRTKANVCVYEILNYTDQDLFRIKPDSLINFEADGTDALIEFGRHLSRGKHYGKRALRVGQRTSFIIPNRGKESVNARTNIVGRGNKHTQHKVWIFCLLESGEEEEASTDYIAGEGMSSLLQYDPDQVGFSISGISGPMVRAVHISETINLPTEDAKRTAGGPTMDVDDP